MEPVLTDERTRLFPIRYEDIWDMYKRQFAAFWSVEEVSLADDLNDWKKLDDDEKYFILMILGFFANSDFIVNENLDENFVEQIKIPELKMLYHYQTTMEDIHSQMYQVLIDTLVKKEEIKERLYNSVKDIECIKKKAEWARKWIKNGSFVQRLVAFSIVEGIFFSASFCSIFWLKKRGLMPGLCQSNELISRDEGMHRDTAVLVYRNHIVNKLEKEQIIEMIRDAVEVEKEFVKESLPYNLKGMNKNLMCDYVEYVADHLSNELLGERIYRKENPFVWMSLISLENKGNFFERKVTNYAKQTVLSKKEENEITFDAEF
jgi:ribonucleoside-diphosphate reductase beta chain